MEDKNKIVPSSEIMQFQNSKTPTDRIIEKGNSYEKLLIELYKENQSFIDKGLFAVSSMAIPLLLNFSQQLTHKTGGIVFLISSLSSFILTIILQLIGCMVARKGCELLTDIDLKKKLGKKYCNIAKKIDYFCILTFILALISVFITTIFTICS